MEQCVDCAAANLYHAQSPASYPTEDRGATEVPLAHFKEVPNGHGGVGEAVDKGSLQKTFGVVQGPHEDCHAAEGGGGGGVKHTYNQHRQMTCIHSHNSTFLLLHSHHHECPHHHQPILSRTLPLLPTPFSPHPLPFLPPHSLHHIMAKSVVSRVDEVDGRVVFVLSGVEQEVHH